VIPDWFQAEVDALTSDRDRLGQCETRLARLLESEHAPGYRIEMLAARTAIHGARMAILVVEQRLQELTRMS
jgi:hypothetical protein